MTFEDSQEWTRAQDAADPPGALREEFLFPERSPLYFAGHSLGLQPRRAREYVLQELDDWARLGVEGHFAARNPWVSYHELLTASTARLVGALPHEVVVMNTLTVNLHLLLVSFYQPRPGKHRLLMERGAFPSDPDAAGLALIGKVNYVSGRAWDMGALVRAAHSKGARIGFDLAHGAGNLLLALHDDGADFAAWCNYKYLNAGPGGLGGVFIHERHA